MSLHVQLSSIVFNDPDIRLLVLINESMGVLNKQKRGGEIPLFFWQKSYASFYRDLNPDLRIQGPVC